MFDPFSIRLENQVRLSDPVDRPRGRDDVVTIPRVWVTSALSILVHVAALWVLLPRLPLLSPGTEQGQATDRLQVQIAAKTPPAPAPPPPPPPRLPAPERETRATLPARARPRPAPPREPPPELVVPRPEVPEIPMPPPAPPVVAEPAPPHPPVEGDLSSFIASRRRARGESATESDTERRDRIVASNMPTTPSPIAGRQMTRGGGLFEITRMAYDDAEFLFFGWNKDAGTRTAQAFQVRLGNNSDMRIAIVRKMIAIVREQEPGDFRWQSWRLDRVVVLSARPEDNAGLEEFLLREMFQDAPQTPYR